MKRKLLTAAAGVGALLAVAGFVKAQEIQPTETTYDLDVGISTWGMPTYFSVDTVIAESKTFIEQYSKLRLKIIRTQHDPLPLAEYYFNENEACAYPSIYFFTDETKQYLQHRINIMFYDSTGVTPCMAAGSWTWLLNGNSFAFIPFGIYNGSNISSDPEAGWTLRFASIMTHEFLHCIDVNSDSCPSLGFNNQNDPGWKTCYKTLLASLTEADYLKIIGVPSV